MPIDLTTTNTSGTGSLTLTGTNAVGETSTLNYTTNLALNDSANEVDGSLPMASSSSDSGWIYRPTLANDGDTTTNYWVSAPRDLSRSPQQLQVDLGSSVTLGRVTMIPRVGFGPKSYTVETSDDQTRWTTRATVVNGADGTISSTFTPVRARFVRIDITASYGSGPPTWTQVKELQVFAR